MKPLTFLQFIEATVTVQDTPGYVVPMSSCPRYKGCSIPVCPLDTKSQNRSRLNTEEVCTFTMHAKHIKEAEHDPS